MNTMSELSRAELKYTVQRQQEELKTVNEVGRLLTTTTDSSELCYLLAMYLKNTFPLALFGLLLSKNKHLSLVHFTPMSETDILQTVPDIVAAANPLLSEPINESELEVDTKDAMESGSAWSQAPIRQLRSHHASKITFNQKTIGVLNVFSGKDNAFTPEDRHVIDTVADQLSAALHNALLLEELSLANQLKNDLLMVLTHELRTPLTPIREGVNLLLDQTLGTINAEQEDFLKTISDNTDRLNKLVERTLLASRIMGDKLTLDIKPLPAGELLKTLNADFMALATQKGVQFTLPTPAQPIEFESDPKLILIALGHLVENAIHATPQGGSVTVQCTQRTGWVNICIKDTGPGIPEESGPQLFEKFRSVGGINDRKTGGLGLGLFIANAIIKAHQGTLTLKNAEVGAHAIVDIPLKQKIQEKTD